MQHLKVLFFAFFFFKFCIRFYHVLYAVVAHIRGKIACLTEIEGCNQLHINLHVTFLSTVLSHSARIHCTCYN